MFASYDTTTSLGRRAICGRAVPRFITSTCDYGQCLEELRLSEVPHPSRMQQHSFRDLHSLQPPLVFCCHFEHTKTVVSRTTKLFAETQWRSPSSGHLSIRRGRVGQHYRSRMRRRFGRGTILSKIITDLFVVRLLIVVAVLYMYFDGNPPERDPPRRRLQPRP